MTGPLQSQLRGPTRRSRDLPHFSLRLPWLAEGPAAALFCRPRLASRPRRAARLSHVLCCLPSELDRPTQRVPARPHVGNVMKLSLGVLISSLRLRVGPQLSPV